jgi:hypothetical protein
MVTSVLSPCLQCGRNLQGIQCIPRNRSRCARFLDYIGRLNRIRAHGILLKELKEFVTNPVKQELNIRR